MNTASVRRGAPATYPLTEDAVEETGTDDRSDRPEGIPEQHVGILEHAAHPHVSSSGVSVVQSTYYALLQAQ